MSRIKSIPAAGNLCLGFFFFIGFGLSSAGLCACLQGFGYLLFLDILFCVPSEFLGLF